MENIDFKYFGNQASFMGNPVYQFDLMALFLKHLPSYQWENVKQHSILF